MNRAQIEHFWLQHQAGELTTADAAVLTEELTRNRLQRRLLLRDGELDRTLDTMALSERNVDAFTSQVFARWRKERKQNHPVPSRNGHHARGRQHHTDLFDEPEAQDTRTNKGRYSWRTLAIAATLLVAVLVFGAVLLRRPTDPRADLADAKNQSRQDEPKQFDAPPLPPQVALPGQDAPRPPLLIDRPQEPRNDGKRPQLMNDNRPPSRKEQGKDKKPGEGSVARLTTAEACHWKGIVPEEWLGTDVLNLQAGKATVTFHDGAVVEMFGPCIFELNSTKEGILRHGKLRAVVPPRAVGFRIPTPAGTVVDLGTVFTVDVEAEKAATVTVEKGTVEFEETGIDGKPGSRTVLKEGETKRFQVKQQLGPKLGGGGFHAQLVINGKVFDFDNPEEFEKAKKKWLEDMQRQMQNPFGPMPSLPQAPRPPFFGPNRLGPNFGQNRFGPRLPFYGMLFINGQLVEFHDPVEYQKAWKKMMESMGMQP